MWNIVTFFCQQISHVFLAIAICYMDNQITNMALI